MTKKRGLGRGLHALLGDAPATEWSAQARPIPISQIRPNPWQPRRRFDDAQLEELAASIRQQGVLAPILVRPSKDGFELIAGERRWRAAQKAGIAEIPAVVREVDDRTALELAIVENLQREDLTPIESARAYQRLVQEFGLTHQEIAERVGISRAQVSNTLRLLQLPEEVQQMVDRGELPMGLARPLVGLEPAQAIALARRAVQEGWTARRMEKEAKKKPSAPKSKPKPDPNIEALAEELTRATGLPVRLRVNAKGGGELTIRFSRPEELDGVLAKLRASI